jgi:N-terminal region of Chorein or VPS13
VQLHDLKLKPEALVKKNTNKILCFLIYFFFVISQYELKLPIEVREGLIGTVSLNIPWNGILNQPVVLTIEVKMKIYCTVKNLCFLF